MTAVHYARLGQSVERCPLSGEDYFGGTVRFNLRMV